MNNAVKNHIQPNIQHKPANQWLSTKEVASLVGVTDRMVRYNVTREVYNDYRVLTGQRARGGIRYQIALKSLPQPIQSQYQTIIQNCTFDQTPTAAHHTAGQPTAAQPTAAAQTPAPYIYANLSQYTEKQRRAADIKVGIVQRYKAALSEGISANDFIKSYNEQNKNNKERTAQKITRASLLRWQAVLQKNNNDPAALIDNRGGKIKTEPALAEPVKDFFNALYYHPNKRTVASCYRRTAKEFQNIELPSLSYFERMVKNTPLITKIKLRDGEKAFKDNIPSMRRDKTLINSNDLWVSDHRLFDVFVKNENGKIFRPWITCFYDFRSNFPISYVIREADPNAMTIKEALRKGIAAHGVPAAVLFDNGKDYKSKELSNINIDTELPPTILSRLGITRRFALPYNARAKTIERFFGTVAKDFDKTFETYTGQDAKNRPEHMRVKNDKIAEKAPNLREFIACFDKWIEDYKNRESKAQGLDGKTPRVTYYENLKEKSVCDAELLTRLCGKTEKRTVIKGNINILKTVFTHTSLYKYNRKEVLVTFNPDNLSEVYVDDIKGVGICVATPEQKYHPTNATYDDFRAEGKRRKNARKLASEIKALNIPFWDSITKNKTNNNTAAAPPPYEQPLIKTTEHFIDPQIKENQEIYNKSKRKTNVFDFYAINKDRQSVFIN